MSYQTFKDEWLGKFVDADGAEGFQCPDPIRQYLYELSGAPKTGAWGNALDYVRKPATAFLKYVQAVPVANMQQGDIAVLYTAGHNGDLGWGNGHITLVDSVSANDYVALEQNGHTGTGAGKDPGDAIRLRTIPKNRIAGVYRPLALPQTPQTTQPTVFLPSAAGPWRLYDVSKTPVKGNEKAFLRPDKWPPGLSYAIRAYHDNGNTVEIQTEQFGVGKIWIKGTEAVIKG